MTQKEQIIKATQMAMRIKSIAHSLRYDARDYDVRFPIEYADQLEQIAEDFLSQKKKGGKK